jgi:hypothetical protein
VSRSPWSSTARRPAETFDCLSSCRSDFTSRSSLIDRWSDTLRIVRSGGTQTFFGHAWRTASCLIDGSTFYMRFVALFTVVLLAPFAIAGSASSSESEPGAVPCEYGVPTRFDLGTLQVPTKVWRRTMPHTVASMAISWFGTSVKSGSASWYKTDGQKGRVEPVVIGAGGRT